MLQGMRVLGLAATCSVLLSCGGGGGGGDSGGGSGASSGGGSSAPPTVTLVASPETVTVGTSTTLTWTSSPDATECTAIGGGWTGPKPLNGSEASPPVFAATQFRLNCRNANASASALRTVNVAVPTLELSVSPTVLSRGETATVSWTATGVTYCEAGWSGFPWERPFSGTETFDPTSRNEHIHSWRISMTCSASGVYVTRSVDVTVRTFAGRFIFQYPVTIEFDINDPDAPYHPNDTWHDAGGISYLNMVSGYVNQPGTGAPGRSFANGDLSDFIHTGPLPDEMIEIRLSLLDVDMSQPPGQRTDADFYLYDYAGNLLDASVGSGSVESIIVDGGTDYRVEIRSVTGATSYLMRFLRATSPAARTPADDSPTIVPGEAIVTLDPDREVAERALERHGLRWLAGDFGREMRVALPADLPAALVRVQPKLKSRIAEMKQAMAPALADRLFTELYIKELAVSAGIRHASPNRIYVAHATPNDPLYPAQRWHYEQIGLPAAWDITTGSADVVVAVVDSGVVRTHIDLWPRFRDGYDFVSDSGGLDGDGLDPDFDDPGFNGSGQSIYHGTHVAGTIGAIGNNSLGVSGVNWNVGIMPVRVLDGRSGTTYDVLQGTRYAAGLPNDSGILPSRRADIINLSLGGHGDCLPAEIAVFQEVRAAGVIVVASAGNSGSNSEYAPASCPHVVNVAAVGGTGVLTNYSNYGHYIDVVAPGGDSRFDSDANGIADAVMSTHARGAGDGRQTSYDYLEGTSMAAPHVAGVFALMKSVRPELTADELDALLIAGTLTDRVAQEPTRQDYGHGLINAYKAVRAAQGVFDSGPQLLVSPGSVIFMFSDVGAETFGISNGGGGLLTIESVQSTVPWLTIEPMVVDINGLGSYRARLHADALPPVDPLDPGFHHIGSIEIESSAGERLLPVYVPALGLPTGNIAAPFYVLITDAETGEIVMERRAVHTRYHHFTIDDLPPGRYFVTAGTDIDHDGFICDPGEMCGSYPGVTVPEVLEYLHVHQEVDIVLRPTALQPGATAIQYRGD